MEKLRRPVQTATRLERIGFVAELRQALDRLGVEPGGAFLVSGVEVTEPGGLGPFARDSETSRQAALANYPRSGTQRWRVLRRIAAAGERGRTREELAAELKLEGNTIRPRVRELLEGDFIEDSGRTRPTRMENKSEVLVLTPKGAREHTAHA